MATLVPGKIGKYDVNRIIGRGGMGVVYQATDPFLDRRVAIKMITATFAEDPDMLKRFFREAQSLGSLQHPNIVTVFDLGDYNGNPYLVMEYLEGEGLDSVLSNHRQLSLLEKITVVIQVCHGLGYAHRRGVIHRDIKPANIMLCKEGGVKIFDFGIAYVRHQNMTRTGQVLGTLRYMAPEQFKSQAIDARADIFSTGVVLYQLFTDHMPFEAENTATTMLKIVHDPPLPLNNFLSTYPPEMEQILLRSLAKDPEERYTSADEFALDLAQLQGQLKEELIGREMKDVAAFLEQGDVYKAQGSLLRVLKINQQHTSANRLLREIQQRIQRDEIGKQVLELRQFAEEALVDEHFDKALEHVDRALVLDRTNTDLQQLREEVRGAAARAEKLHKALKAAEAAQAEGKLDAAKEAAEAALAVAPNDTQAKTLLRLISREIEERARQKELDGYLQEARQQISSRKFTAALDILKRAEELDPAAPHVRALLESAVAGREQDRRRREVEALVREVEDALNKDDYPAACAKADQGLARFPDDRTLLKLKTLAERQRQIEERKRFVDEQLTMAHMLLQAGRNEELHEQLENAIAQIGTEPRLESLLAVVSENLERERSERMRAEGMRQARQFLDNHALHDGIQALERLARDVGDDTEIRDLLTRTRSEQAEAVQDALGRAEQEADLDRRMKILKDALQKSPQDGRLKEQMQNVGNLRQVIAEIGAEARQLEESRHYDRALAKWDTVRTVYPQYPDLKNIIARVRGLRDRAQTNARQNWIDKIESSLTACEFDQASALVEQATQAFPWDTDLMELQERTEAAVRDRGKAQKMLAEGRKLFANQQWEAGAQMMMRACQLASADSLIRDQAIGELAQASRATVEINWRASEAIVRMLAEIQPGAVGSPDLHASIQERRREEAIASAMVAAKRRQAGGDPEAALHELEQVLGWYPEDRRLVDLQRLLKESIEQTREASRRKSQRVDLLQAALAGSDYKRAEDLLTQARRDFPGDREFAEIEKKVREGMASRAQAEKLLAGAAKSVDKGKWKKALELFQEANAAAKSDSVIRGHVVSGLTSAADAALNSEVESSEMLAAEAARVDPNSPLLAPVRTRIEARKRSQLAEQCLGTAQRMLSSGDWQGALRSLERGLAASPEEPRLLEFKARIEHQIGKRDDDQRRAREQEAAQQEARQKEARQKQLREELERARAREASAGQSKSHWNPVSSDAEELSATRLFTPGFVPPAPDIAARVEASATFPAKPDPQPAAPIPTLYAPPAQATPESSEAKRGLRDATPPANNPPTAAFAGGLTQGTGNDQVNESALQIVERQLAAFIGPLAKVLVKRAAAKTTNAPELYEILAAVLEREDDRKAFLAKRVELGGSYASAPASVPAPVQAAPTVNAPMDLSSPSEITPAAIEQAARRLAAHLGPIATVLARKDAKRAVTLREFYGLLAQHVTNASDRERFLKEAGVQ
jgi:serine/threonine-protein kinase